MSPDLRHHIFQAPDEELFGVRLSTLRLFVHGYLQNPGIEAYVVRAIATDIPADTRNLFVRNLAEIIGTETLNWKTIQGVAPSLVFLAEYARKASRASLKSGESTVIPEEVIPTKVFCDQLLEVYHAEMRFRYSPPKG